MGLGRSVFRVAVDLPMLGAAAMFVAVNRLTTWTRPRSILEPTRREGTSADVHLEEILDEMEEQGDDLADKTIEGLYECGGVAAVQAANIMMQQEFDRKWCELCDPDMMFKPEESEDEGQRICRIMEEKQRDVRLLTEIEVKEIETILSDYNHQIAQEPAWIDRDLIEKGEEAFEKYGMIGFAALACGSLPAGYAAPEATKVLGFTQLLRDINSAKRRLIETSLFIMAVKQEGGLTFPHGEGILAIRNVRLMHAGVRFLLRKTAHKHDLEDCHPMWHAFLTHHWDEQKDGVPINQVMMCATMLCFSYIALRCFQQMGIQLSEEQERGYLHCWNVAAHVMGIQGKLLLNPGRENIKEAEALFNAIWRRHGAKKSDGVKLDDGRKLTEALLKFLESPFKAEGKSSARVIVEQSYLPIDLVMESVPRLLMRQFIGEYGTDVLDIKLDWSQRLLLWLVSPTLQRLPELKRIFPRLWGLKRLPMEEVAEQIFKGMLDNPLKNFPRPGREAAFQIPTKLKKRAGIKEMTTLDV